MSSMVFLFLIVCFYFIRISSDFCDFSFPKMFDNGNPAGMSTESEVKEWRQIVVLSRLSLVPLLLWITCVSFSLPLIVLSEFASNHIASPHVTSGFPCFVLSLVISFFVFVQNEQFFKKIHNWVPPHPPHLTDTHPLVHWCHKGHCQVSPNSPFPSPTTTSTNFLRRPLLVP